MVNMGRWRTLDRIFGWNNHTNEGHRSDRLSWLHEEETLLPHHGQNTHSAIPPAEVAKTCLKLRHLIQECIPCEMEESKVTRAHSRIITKKVIDAAKSAGGEEARGCVVFCLLVNKRWFSHEADVELWDADLHSLRAVACGVIAKQIIETEEDNDFLMHAVLLRRYSFLINGQATRPLNAIERAVDLHEVRVIGSSGYQKCISHLWRGWLVQDEDDPTVFVDYKDKANPNFLVHMDPDRMRAPMYQNAAQMLFSIVYLILYTSAINSINPSGEFDGAEVLLYVFTIGFVCEQVVKFYKAGYQIFGFWDAFNGILYSFLTASFVLRVLGLSHRSGSSGRTEWSEQSYNILAFVAPMFWGRLLLYLDSFRFFGAMLVVLKVMMKESVIFFALLIIIIIGFLQAFIGLDFADDLVAGDVWFIMESMLKAILGSPEFDGFEQFGHPWGLILYYCFTFIVMIILLNILIALYNSAYEDIYGNADDEYLALLAQKTMQFVRAPDENVYIPPLNLIEIVVSGLFEWWMPDHAYEILNDCVMGVLYSPLLVVSAFFETRKAADIRFNRSRGEEDDDVIEEWEQMNSDVDAQSEEWAKICDAAKSNVEDDPAMVELEKLRTDVTELKAMLKEISQAVGADANKAAAAVEEEQAENEPVLKDAGKKKKDKGKKKEDVAAARGSASSSE